MFNTRKKSKCGQVSPLPPKFYDQFIKLWKLLFDVGVFGLPIFSGTITSFPLPPKSSSKLIGKPFLVDPTSIVRLYSFVSQDLDGPIVKDGYSLEPYNDQVKFKISWKVPEDVKDFIIGFYRSDGFSDDATNTFSLICGNKGASIFPKTSGSFISPGITNLFVAANKDTIIELEVNVVIPNKIYVPEISEDNPYIKYITVKDNNCRNVRVPVYRLSISEDCRHTVKKPSKYFREATKVIQNYLRTTGLSVTLMFDTISKSSLTNNLQVCISCTGVGCGPGVIGTYEYGYFSDDAYSSVTTNTDATCDHCYGNFTSYLGIRLDIPSGKVPRISFIVNPNTVLENYSYLADVGVYYRASLAIFYAHNKLDANGDIQGTAEENINVPAKTTRTFTGSYKLPVISTAFSIIVYYYITGGRDSSLSVEDALRLLMGRSTFESVKIEYVDKVSPV